MACKSKGGKSGCKTGAAKKTKKPKATGGARKPAK